MWTTLVFASNKIITFGATLVLARILTPSDFGLVALAGVAIGFLALLSDLGLGGSLVVRKHLDDRAAGTILTLMLLMGALTTALIAAAAPVVAAIFDEPRLAPVLAILGIGVVLSAPAWFYSTVLQRELEFKRRFRCQLAQSLTFAIVSVSTAAAGAGYWSLVAGHLAGTMVFVIALGAAAPYRVRPTLEWVAAKEALKEGRGFLAQSGLAFFESNTDSLSVGGFLGSAQLGFYSMAYRVGELPYWAVTEPVATVTFPGFARMRHRGESVAASFLSVLSLVALVACPMGVLLSATANVFTLTLFGSEWLPMAGVLAILGIWGTLNHVEASIGWLMNSVDRAGLNAGISAGTLPVFIVATVLAASLGSIETVAWVMLAHVAVSLMIRMVAADRILSVPLGDQWRAIRPVLLGSAAAWAVARALADALTWAAPITLGAALVAGAGSYVAVISIAEPGVIRRSIEKLRRTIKAAADPQTEQGQPEH